MTQTDCPWGRSWTLVGTKVVSNMDRSRLNLCYHSSVPRTNSDSALHQSTMAPTQVESFTGGSQDAQQKRGMSSHEVTRLWWTNI